MKLGLFKVYMDLFTAGGERSGCMVLAVATTDLARAVKLALDGHPHAVVSSASFECEVDIIDSEASK